MEPQKCDFAEIEGKYWKLFDSKTFLKIIFRYFEFKQIFWTKLFFHSNLSNRIQMTNIWSNKDHHQNYISKIKIILHRIISVVWITNFLSEIRSLTIHDDEIKFLLLSVKPTWIYKVKSLMIACLTFTVKQWRRNSLSGYLRILMNL